MQLCRFIYLLDYYAVKIRIFEIFTKYFSIYLLYKYYTLYIFHVVILDI